MRSNPNNLIASMLVGAAISSLLIPKPIATAAINSYQQPKPAAYSYVAVSPLPQKEKFGSQIIGKTPLDAWLDALVQKESNGDATKKILDVNGRYSYGCLQFQMGTFKAYIARYNLEDEIADGNWASAIYDCSLQRRVAKLMIIENPENWKHWYNSIKTGGIGLPPAD